MSEALAPAPSVSCPSQNCPEPEPDNQASLCPASRTVGTRVDLITVKALLKGTALRRLNGKTYRFCPEPGCDVVYFDREAGSVFEEHDLEVRIGQKKSEDPIPLCYCFNLTVADLRSDITAQGKTDIPAMIAAEVKAGHCACEVKNPQGTCCLGNVNKALKRLELDRSKTETPGQ
jgi:hypothetical protein